MGNYQLARVLNLQGKTDDAADMYQRTLEAQRLLYGDTSTKVGDTLTELAGVRLAQNRVSEAEKLMAESLELSRKIRGASHHTSGYILSALAQIHWRQNKLKLAEGELKSSLEIFATSLPPDHQYVASAEYIMGEVMLSMGRLPDAEAVLTASMNRWKRTDAPAWRAARSASALGETLHRAGHTRDAEKYLLEGYRELTVGNGADAQTRTKARERIAHFYVDTGQREKLNELQLATSHDVTAPAVRPN